MGRTPDAKARANARWLKANPEKAREAVRRWKKNNPGRMKAYATPEHSRRWRAANAEYLRQWRRENRAKLNASAMEYCAAKMHRTPPWLTEEHRAAIRQFYVDAEAVSKATRIKHHVDHVVPLRGSTVSGLHVPWNLQILRATDNLEKGNRVHERGAPRPAAPTAPSN